jgi:hypothetical protein
MGEQKTTDLKDHSTPVCPYCQRRFASFDKLTLHIVTRHTRSGKPKEQMPAHSGSKS